MSIEHVIRAWRDEEYRESLNAEQRAILPESPVGAIDLTESELAEADGGDWTDWVLFGLSSVPAIISWWPSQTDRLRISQP
jgi:mersacidin/lichenicidin family type 2 lantibiotic